MKRSNQRTMKPTKLLLDSIHVYNNFRCFKQIHARLITSGNFVNELVVNRVIEFFGKSDIYLHYACDFLKQLDYKKSSFPFNGLISSYANSGTPKAGILVYRRIVRDGFLPDMYTFPAVLKSCVKIAGIGEGREVHGVVLKMGVVSDLYVQNSLVHFYGACGDCVSACKVFDEMLERDVVSWTGLITGHVKAGCFDKAVDLFLRMDVKPNVATFVSVLVACGRNGVLDVGTGIHGLIVKRALGVNLEASNALIDMYAKCGCLGEAKQVFEELPSKDIFSWTSMINGLVQSKRLEESLELFSEMQGSGVEPDRVILTSLLSACASLGSLDYGRQIHEYIERKKIQWDVQIGTAMVDMYAKCGCIDMAFQIFHGMSSKNIFTWNVLLNGLAMHGKSRDVQRVFDEMVKAGTMPSEVTFLAVLTACCHSGLIDEGRQYFHQMTKHFNISSKLEHYGCMVDLLCRAGLLVEALDLIETMPMPPDVLIVGSLLGACKNCGIAQLPQKVLDCLAKLESQDSGAYVLLSNLYAADQRWIDVTRVRNLMKKKGIKKTPGASVI